MLKGVKYVYNGFSNVNELRAKSCFYFSPKVNKNIHT